MTSVTYSVKEIDPAGRRWLESALGQPLEEGQQVSICIAGTEQDADQGTGRWEEFDRLAAKAEAHIRQQGISDAELDAAIEEAIQHARSDEP